MRSFALSLARAAGLAALTAAASAAAELKLPLPPPPPGKQLDCSRWPAMLDAPAPPTPHFSEMYDLTGIPDIPVNHYSPDDDPCEVHLRTQPPGYCNTECGCADLAASECVNRGDWAPTYDDGPSEFTPNVLNSLKQRGDAKAMFFVVGSAVCRNPKNLIDAVNAGHEIGVHTWSHPRLSSLTNDQIIAEIKYTEKAVMELTGVRPKFMRPPYGNMDQRVKFILDKMGYVPVHWNQDTNDWKYNFVPETADAVAEATRSIIRSVQEHINENFAARLGTISLQHDVAKIPASLAGPVLDQIRHGGWKVVPVTKCLNSTSWYVADEAASASARGGSAAKAVAQAGGNSSSSNAAAAAVAVAVASGNSSGPAPAKSAPAAPLTAGPAKSGAGRVAAVYASSAAVVGSAVAVAVAL